MSARPFRAAGTPPVAKPPANHAPNRTPAAVGIVAVSYDLASGKVSLALADGRMLFLAAG